MTAIVAVAGGATTIKQFLAAEMIDELRLHIAPVELDVGYMRVFDGVGTRTWTPVSARTTADVTHVVYRR